jgi:glycosyltransferase involved in cell wall biosynthesis
MGADLPTVVHVTTPVSWRGGEQQLIWLVEELARLGVPQRVACPPGSAVEKVCRERGWPHLPLRRRASVDLLYARALARACREAGADLVHLHDAHAHTGAVLAGALFGLSAPLILHRRVVIPPRRGSFTRWKWNVPGLRRVLCVSQAVAETVRPILRDPSRLRVVPDGIGAARAAGVVPDGRLRRSLGLGPVVPLVGTVGALGADKDPLTFVETAGRLAAGGLDAHFVLIGDGPLRSEVEARGRMLGLAGRLHLIGFRDDVPFILPELSLLLFTSASEGFGSTLLDAQAWRVPVVATAVGGIPEVVLDGETGLLAPVGDAAALAVAVRRLLGDAALRTRLVEAGARRVGDFTAAKMAERTLEVYREVWGSWVD